MCNGITQSARQSASPLYQTLNFVGAGQGMINPCLGKEASGKHCGSRSRRTAEAEPVDHEHSPWADCRDVKELKGRPMFFQPNEAFLREFLPQ